MTINIIAAMGLNREIGKNNNLLWNLPNDMKRFKELTQNNFVLMGSNTYYSIGKPLSNRQNIVFSRKIKHNFPNDVYVYNSIEDILHEYENYADKQVDMWIIGGQSIYEQFIDVADYLYLTIVHQTFNQADTYFPKFNIEDWKIIEHIDNKADDQHLYDYSFVTYKRK